MANVRGLRDLNNNNNPRNRPNNNNIRNQPMQVGAEDQIPFLTTFKSDRQPMAQSIPYTLKLICCPDLKLCSCTLVFLVLIWIMYIVSLSFGIETKNQDVLEVQQSVLIDLGGVKGSLIQAGQVHRLITGMFLHIDLMHIVMNTITLMFFCSRFEKIYPKQTPIVLLVSAISSFLFTSVLDLNTVMVGAETAINGVLGGFIAFLIINWSALQRFGPIRSTIACIIAFLTFFLLLLSFSSFLNAMAALGSLVSGLLISLAILPPIQHKSTLLKIIGYIGSASIILTTIFVLFLAI